MTDTPNTPNEPDKNFEDILKAFQSAEESTDPKEIEAAAQRVFQHVAEAARDKPSRYLEVSAVAHDFTSQNDWEKAEASYRQALSIAEAEGNPGQIFKAHGNLSSFYSLRNREEEALQSARRALEFAKQTDSIHINAMALEGLAVCLLALSRDAEALATAKELLQILPDEDMFRLTIARAQVLHARCCLRQNDVPQAETDLAAAWPVLSPKAKAVILAGYQSGLANWWDVDADIKLSRGDQAESIASLRKALQHRRFVSQCRQLDGPYRFAHLTRGLKKLGDALAAIGDTAGAEPFLEESRVIGRLTGVLTS